MLKIEKNIPIQKKVTSEIVETILMMEEGDSLFLSYEAFTKTDITNSLANGRIRIQWKGLKLKSCKEINGLRIWAYNPNKN